MMAHIRDPKVAGPAKWYVRGGSFRRNLSHTIQAATLCGAPVTDRDIDARTARAKTHQAWVAQNVCPDCRAKL